MSVLAYGLDGSSPIPNSRCLSSSMFVVIAISPDRKAMFYPSCNFIDSRVTTDRAQGMIASSSSPQSVVGHTLDPASGHGHDAIVYSHSMLSSEGKMAWIAEQPYLVFPTTNLVSTMVLNLVATSHCYISSNLKRQYLPRMAC
nr:hypothetical protein CFP56_66524 [Quercus suber]